MLSFKKTNSPFLHDSVLNWETKAFKHPWYRVLGREKSVMVSMSDIRDLRFFFFQAVFSSARVSLPLIPALLDLK